MTETKAPADDRRAVFVGVPAYVEAGGAILRDLFTEDRGGWLEDVTLLDQLAFEKITVLAEEVRAAEGWKWAQGHIDYPSAHGLARIYPRQVDRSEEDAAKIKAICAEYDSLVEKFAEIDDLPPDVEARLSEIDAALEVFGDGYAYDAAEVARGGVFVVLGHDGAPRIERGFLRPEDVVSEPEPDDGEAGEVGDQAPSAEPETRGEDPEELDGLAPISDKLEADLTAYRTASLRDALAEQPEAAFLAVVHALVLRVFYPAANATCLDIRMASRSLAEDAPGIEDRPACRRIEARHEAWARQLPGGAAGLWSFVVDLDTDSRWAIFAHCVGLSADAVAGWQRRPQALAHADHLATRLALDMTLDWSATGPSYFSRVTKARILEAVGEAAGDEAANRLSSLKKPDMAAAAELLMVGTGWLPILLRTPLPDTDRAQSIDAAA